MLYDISHVSEKSTEPRSGSDDRDKVVDIKHGWTATQRSRDNEMNFRSSRTS